MGERVATIVAEVSAVWSSGSIISVGMVVAINAVGILGGGSHGLVVIERKGS